MRFTAMSHTGRLRRRWGVAGLLAASLAGPLQAAERLRICLADDPPLASATGAGILPELISAMAGLPGAPALRVEVAPFQRSLNNLALGLCDIHLPLIDSPEVSQVLPGLRLAGQPLFSVEFVIATRSRLSAQELAHPDTLHLETDLAHVELFPFAVAPSTCLVCSLRKVNLGRIDGVLFAAREIQTAIAEHNLPPLQLNHYRRFNAYAVVRRGAEGELAARRWQSLRLQLERDGRYQRLLVPLH